MRLNREWPHAGRRTDTTTFSGPTHCSTGLNARISIERDHCCHPRTLLLSVKTTASSLDTNQNLLWTHMLAIQQSRMRWSGVNANLVCPFPKLYHGTSRDTLMARTRWFNDIDTKQPWLNRLFATTTFREQPSSEAIDALPCHKLRLWSIHWISIGFLWTHPCSPRFVLWQFSSNLFTSCSFEGMISSDTFQVPKLFKLKNSRSSRSSSGSLVEAVDHRGGLHKAQAEQLSNENCLHWSALIYFWKQKLFNRLIRAQRLPSSLPKVGLFVPDSVAVGETRSHLEVLSSRWIKDAIRDPIVVTQPKWLLHTFAMLCPVILASTKTTLPPETRLDPACFCRVPAKNKIRLSSPYIFVIQGTPQISPSTGMESRPS